MAARAYVVDIAGGTATATVQIQATQTLKSMILTWVNAAAGKIELSLSSTSQIGRLSRAFTSIAPAPVTWARRFFGRVRTAEASIKTILGASWKAL